MAELRLAAVDRLRDSGLLWAAVKVRPGSTMATRMPKPATSRASASSAASMANFDAE
jgi:hypothetical protein